MFQGAARRIFPEGLNLSLFVRCEPGTKKGKAGTLKGKAGTKKGKARTKRDKAGTQKKKNVGKGQNWHQTASNQQETRVLGEMFLEI